MLRCSSWFELVLSYEHRVQNGIGGMSLELEPRVSVIKVGKKAQRRDDAEIPTLRCWLAIDSVKGTTHLEFNAR